jgi:hypothetical protein
MGDGVEYKPGERFYGFHGNMSRKDEPSFGIVKSYNPRTRRASGEIVGLQRTFKEAYCISGGSRWGVSTCPRINDIVSLCWDNSGNCWATPQSINYGSLVVNKNEESLADSSFYGISPGEIHAHSFGHSETYQTNTGDWFVHDGMGDFIHLFAAEGTYHLRTFHEKREELGYDDNGDPGVLLQAGLQPGWFYEDETGWHPEKSQWVLQVNNKIELNTSSAEDGFIDLVGPNNALLHVDTTGLVVNGQNVIVQGVDNVTVDATAINLNSGDKGAARLDDETTSTPAEDSQFWQFITALITGLLNSPTTPLDGGSSY